MSDVAHTLLLGLLLSAACGHHPSGPGPTQAAYREMRAAEADVERGARAHGAGEDGGLETLCEGASRVCELAESVAESDAAGRCAQAQRRCEEAGGQCCGAESP